MLGTRAGIMVSFVFLNVVVACSDGTDSATPATDAGSTSTPPDGGAASSGGTTDADAPTKCTTLVTAFCTRSVACDPSDAGATQQRIQDCVTSAGADLRCASATSVSGSYDTCVAEIPKVECAKFNDPAADVLPPSCHAVVQTPEPPDAGSPGPTPGAGKPNIVLGRTSSLGDFNVYLGCVCDSTDPDSIASPVGLYGSQSRFQQNSIWNRFGAFGSDFSSQSACGQFASDPPVVVNNGVIVGRLTRNQSIAGGITDPDVQALLLNEVCRN